MFLDNQQFKYKRYLKRSLPKNVNCYSHNIKWKTRQIKSMKMYSHILNIFCKPLTKRFFFDLQFFIFCLFLRWWLRTVFQQTWKLLRQHFCGPFVGRKVSFEMQRPENVLLPVVSLKFNILDEGEKDYKYSGRCLMGSHITLSIG